MDPELRIKFYGTRGSIPISDPDFQEFGGDTTCISITNNITNQLSILDAGTGIRKLGKEVMSNDNSPDVKDIVITFSHFHWDHILGFPFFDPLYDTEKRITIMAMGENWPVKDLREIFDVAMQTEYFPLKIDDMKARINFETPGKDVQILENSLIIGYKHKHPGGAYSYRIEWFDKILTICTDIEHEGTLDPDIIELARNSDLLIHDGQYTPEELERKKGYGHSSYAQAAQLAQEANCKQLIVTHHDPDHNDDFLRDMEKKCQQIFPDSFFAREGTEVVI